MQFHVNLSLWHTFSYTLAHQTCPYSCTHLYPHIHHSFIYTTHSYGWLIHMKVQVCTKIWAKLYENVSQSDSFTWTCEPEWLIHMPVRVCVQVWAQVVEKKWGLCRCIEFMTHVYSSWVMYSSWQDFFVNCLYCRSSILAASGSCRLIQLVTHMYAKRTWMSWTKEYECVKNMNV